MKKRTTMTYAVAAATAATLLLAGCKGGDDDPTATPTGTSVTSSPTSPTGSSSVTSSAPPSPSVSVSLPSAARANSEAGAVEFAKFFVAAMDSAYVSTDTSALSALSSASCSDCATVVKAIALMKSEGVHQRSNVITIDSAVFTGIGGAETVDVFATSKKAERVDSAGRVKYTVPEETGQLRLTLAFSDNSWSVVKLVQQT